MSWYKVWDDIIQTGRWRAGGGTTSLLSRLPHLLASPLDIYGKLALLVDNLLALKGRMLALCLLGSLPD